MLFSKATDVLTLLSWVGFIWLCTNQDGNPLHSVPLRILTQKLQLSPQRELKVHSEPNLNDRSPGTYIHVFPSTICSSVEALSWSFYSNRTKKGVNQSIFKNTLVETLSGQLHQQSNLSYRPQMLSDSIQPFQW